MGQYYKALIIKEIGSRKPNRYGVVPSPRCSAMTLSPSDYDATLKLFEWDINGCVFLDTVLSQFVRPLDDGKKRLLAFVGDYSEMKEVELHKGLEDFRYEIADAHDAVWNKYGDRTLRNRKAVRTIDTDTDRLYAVDRTAMEYTRLFDLPRFKDWEDYRTNPVGVLCATSNGLGGGDYSGVNEDMAGRWAFHDIVVTETAPIGYTEISPNFVFDD